MDAEQQSNQNDEELEDVARRIPFHDRLFADLARHAGHVGYVIRSTAEVKQLPSAGYRSSRCKN